MLDLLNQDELIIETIDTDNDFENGIFLNIENIEEKIKEKEDKKKEDKNTLTKTKK